ncbi:MAG: leucine-rich repeat protein [Bacteroidaceae bacterium]|nr:leucine-rich repeat protein [Bacteroidaceae bacterium]
MKKQIILFILILLPMMANAYDVEINGIYYNLKSETKQAEVTRGAEYTGEIVIPEYVTYESVTYSVTAIGNSAFYGCKGLSSVTIPNSVTNILVGAFQDCTSLTHMEIPNSVTTIDSSTFRGCTGLISLTIPNSVKRINSLAFLGCTNLTSIIIPSSVSFIDQQAFDGCSGLTSISVESGNVTYDSRENCNAIIETSTNTLIVGCKKTIIPGNVTSIGGFAFSRNTGITSIIIPNGVTNIDTWAFNGCSGLTSITISSSVTRIDLNAFDGCSGLTSISVENGNAKYDSRGNCNAIIETSTNTLIVGCKNTIIPGSVTSIGVLAFSGNNSLTSITIPSSVQRIYSQAFCGCSSLTSIIIPRSVTIISNQAFQGCSGLTSISVESGNTIYDSRGNCNAIIETSTNTLIAGCKNTIIPNSVTNIGSCAFMDCSGLTFITIPNSVTNIDNYAFWGCGGLKNVYCYAENVPTTASEAFVGSPIESATLHVPASSVAKYKASSPWNFFGNITSLKRKTITYVVDGEVYKTYEIYCNAPITPEPAPTKEGYTFSGWSKIPETMPDEDVVVTGSFTINSYTLTYMLDGKVYKTSSVAYGTTLTPEVVTSKEGYTFSGWSTIPIKMPAHDVVVTGSFTANKYMVTYIVDGKKYKSYEIDYNSVLNPESAPIKKGMTFSGWGEVPETMPAHDVTLSGTYSWSQKTLNSAIYQVIDTLNNYAAVIGNEKVSGDVKILPSVEMGGYDYAVTLIGNSAFNKCSELASITIPESVTSIESNAFSGCSNLHTVSLKSNPIVSKAYTANSSLKKIFGEQVQEYIVNGNVTSIGSYAFSECSNVTSVTIGNNVTSIGENAFSNCSGLTSVRISDLTAWCQISFSKSSSGNSYSNPACMAHHLFLNGEEIKDLVIPSNVNSISNLAFWACHGLTSVTIPSNVKSIGQSAFASCRGLTSANIENGVTNIEKWAFYNCQALTSVTIGNSVTSIGEGAFNKCPNLTSINIPQSVTSIGNNAFVGCSGLSSVTVCTDYLSLSGMFPDSKNVEKLIYGEGCTKTVSTGLTSVSEVVLPKTLQTIDAKTFYNFRNLKEITIPQSVTTIGENAFYGCSYLESVKVLVTDYSDFCTNKIVSLIKSRIGKPVMLIDENGNEIKDFRIPEGVTTVGEYAFCNCSGLTSVLIPSSVTSISQQAFSGCNNVEKLIYGEGCTKTVSTGLTSVSEVVLPKTLQTIDANAFYNFRNLKTITIPQSVTSIGQHAFYGCAALASVTIENNNLTEIGQNAFPSQAKLYVKRGTKTLLTLWKNGYTRPYEIGTDKQLPPSSLSVVSTTQMTATVKVNDFYDGYAYTFNDEKIGKDTKTLSVPYPGYKFNQPLKISLDDVLYTTNPYSFQTKGLNMKAERTGSTASSMTVKASYEHGDAPVTAQTLSLGGVTVEDDEIYLNGLKPSASYTVTYTIITDGPWKFQQTFKFSTNALNFTASQPKVISEGNVIIASKSNLDDGETNVGFEWRRTDWTSEFPSNRAGAYLYEGMMEGYIRNLNTNYLWKYRPYYETQDGSRFYGDWTGIDPTNTSYFEPTVHTYDKIEVNGNRARVKGYAMRGSDNIVSQGFRYWRSTESASRAKQVEADGQVMSIELRGLDYHTTYRVVAFVTTSEGKTYYGKEQLFTTGDQTGIEETFADEPRKITEEGIYDLSGRKLERMQKGINIIRKADGTTRKVLVK